MNPSSRADDLERIRRCLSSIAEFLRQTDRSRMTVSYSRGGDPTTSLDRAIDRLIFATLPRPGEGWLSEEDCSADTRRLSASRVWVVDPIDGTREFVEGIPEWCVSIGLIEDREPVAGGVLNPSTGELFWGARESGLQTTRGTPPEWVGAVDRHPLLLVSRREYREGKWRAFEQSEVTLRPVGSIAYRLALVAAGDADATGTFQPRHEWDVAAGIALVLAAGGRAVAQDGSPLRFNRQPPRLENSFAFAKHCPAALPALCGVPATQSPELPPTGA